MKKLATTVLSMCLAFSAASVFAADAATSNKHEQRQHEQGLNVQRRDAQRHDEKGRHVQGFHEQGRDEERRHVQGRNEKGCDVQGQHEKRRIVVLIRTPLVETRTWLAGALQRCMRLISPPGCIKNEFPRSPLLIPDR